MQLGFDPAVKGVGVAQLGADGLLVAARFYKTPPWGEEGWTDAVMCSVQTIQGPVSEAWIEFPQVYGKSRAPAEDILRIAAVSGGIACAVRSSFPTAKIRFVLPRVWKKNVPKEVMLRRIFESLTEEERARIEETRASYVGDALDAIGIAKWGFRNSSAGVQE